MQLGHGGILYGVVTILIIAAAVYTQANLLYWGFGLMIGGLLLSIAWSIATLRGLEVDREIPGQSAAGEPLALRYKLINRGILPVFGLTLTEAWGLKRRGFKRAGPYQESPPRIAAPPQAWVLHVSPGGTLQAESTCWPAMRGPLRFEQLQAVTSFPFGILKKTVTFSLEDETLIYPAIYKIRRHMLGRLTVNDGDGRQIINRPGGGEEFHGIRPYRQGDSLRMIDWKRTARSGELAAREMTTPRPPQLRLLLDLREPPPDGVGNRSKISGRALEEQAISLTASIICDGFIQGLRVGLTVLGPECKTYYPMHSTLHRMQMLEALSRLDLNRPRDPASVIRDQFSVVIWAGQGTATPNRLGLVGPSAVTVLGAADLDQYTIDSNRTVSLEAALPRSAQTHAPARAAG